MNKYLLIPNRETTADISHNSTRVQLGEPMSLLGLLIGLRVGGTYRSRGDLRAAVSPKSHPSKRPRMEAGILKFSTNLKAAGTKIVFSSGVLTASITLEREGPCESGQFQRVPEICGLFAF